MAQEDKQINLLYTFLFASIFLVTLSIFVFFIRVDHVLSDMSRPDMLFNEDCVTHSGRSVPEWGVCLNPSAERFFYVISKFPCSWIGSGERSCVFEFSGGKYVLKILKAPQYRSQVLRSLLFWMKPSMTENLRSAIFNAKIAAEELFEETGVVYAHLNVSKSGMPNIQYKDYFGRELAFHADRLRFVIQKKAVPLISVITKAMARGEVDRARECIKKVVALYGSLAKKGYGHSKVFSIGFSDKKPIIMNIWYIHTLPSCAPMQRFAYTERVVLLPLRLWLKTSYPELLPCFEQECEKMRF